MPQVIRTDEAERDLVDILVRLSRFSASAADRFAAEVDQKCQLLAQFPGMGGEREDLQSGIRDFSVGNFVLFYRPIQDGIELLRVFHGGQQVGPRHFS